MSIFKKRRLKLNKRDCAIKMKLVPYGAGWTDVYLDIGNDSLYFIISSAMGDSFDDLLYSLYYLAANNNDPLSSYAKIEYKRGILEHTNEGYRLTHVVDYADENYRTKGTIFRDIPWKANFTWNEEGAESYWTLERNPDESEDFDLKIHIEHMREELEVYDYTVRYSEFCYAVTKACTETLKEYGIYGYHYSNHVEDMNLRYLLFLKSVALGNYDARKLTFYDEQGHGETTDFQSELELLLFDM